MTIVILVIIIIALLVVLVYSLYLSRVERVDTSVGRDSSSTPETEQPQEDDSKPINESKPEPEIVNLVDYFSSDAEPVEKGIAREKEKKESPAATASIKADSSADFDKLTELKTGRGYLLDCKRRLEQARGEGRVYAAAYFDYDRFSFVNNLKGMFSGDCVLTRTAMALPDIFPENSLITRISADHFAVVFPLIDQSALEGYHEELMRVCETLRDDLGVRSSLKIALGYAITEGSATGYDVSVLLNKANVARHCRKVSKSDSFEVFDPAMLTSFFFGESAMESYNECQYVDDIAVYYLPQSDLTAGKISMYQALARWSYDDKELSAISLENGRVPSSNTKVIYQVCRAMSRWRKSGREVAPVCVELPITALFKDELDEFILRCLGEFQLEPAMLLVDIDVSIIRTDWTGVCNQIKKLDEIGVRVGVSGIDTGYVSFDFLAGLRLSFMRLHKSFAYGAETADDKLDLCRRMVEAAASINIQAVFEGVDTAERAAALKTVGGRYVVGRYSGRPYNADEIVRSLPENTEKPKSAGDAVIPGGRDFSVN